MKVLHISNFKNLSGYSTQAINSILALDSVGIEVVPRHINILNNTNLDLPARILELEKQDDQNPSHVILNTLPSLYERQGNAKHLGFYVCETSNFRAAGWQHKINLMDAGIVCNYHNKVASQESGVKIPLHIVPQAIDVTRFDREYKVHPFREQNKNAFIFYTIGELTQRKNLAAILRAFYTEFSPNENVQLFIKTSPTPNEIISDLINKVQKGLKIYKNNDRYKKAVFAAGFCSEEEISSIHQSFDCYVTSSRGEAFNIPLADSMLAGNSIVSPNHSGMDYITEKNAFVVKSYPESCFGAIDTLENLYTAQELWYEINIDDLRLQMRNAYQKRDLAKKKIQQGKKDVQKFAYLEVGKIYKKVLEAI